MHKLSKFFLNKNKELVKIIVLKEAACLAVLEMSTSLGNKSKKRNIYNNWAVSGWNGKHFSYIKHQSFSDRTRIACLAGLEIATWLDKGWLF